MTVQSFRRIWRGYLLICQLISHHLCEIDFKPVEILSHIRARPVNRTPVKVDVLLTFVDISWSE